MKLKVILLFFLIVTSLRSAAQGGTKPGSTGASISLPLYFAGQTLTGKVNDVSNPAGFVSPYTIGPDYFFYHKALTSGNIFIDLSFVTVTGTQLMPSISVWEGKPGAGGILIQSVTSIGDETVDNILRLSFKTVVNKQYWIMLDCGTTDGYDYSVFIYNSPVQGACSNIGFENGDFTNWIETDGSATEGCATAQHPVYFPNSSLSNSNLNTATQHRITRSGTDAIGGFKKVCPGLESKSLRIGDSTKTMRRHNANTGVISNGASVEQQFLVTKTNSLFTYYYAVVLEASGHAPSQQPTFRVDAFDKNGGRILCGEYLVVASGAIPGFVNAGPYDDPNDAFPIDPSDPDVYYKTWTPVFIDLSKYIDSSITVRFTVMDCSEGAHFGYAYVDAVCQPLEITGNSSVCNGGQITLHAPQGGATYKWTIKGAPAVLGTKDSLVVNPAVPTTYQCEIVSVAGCITLLDKLITPEAKPIISTISGDLAICSSEIVNLTANGSADTLSPWKSSNPLVASIDITGKVTGLTAGNTTISYKSLGGCLRDTLLTVSVNATVTGTTAFCKGLTTQLTNTTQSPDATTPWSTANGAIATVDNNGLVTGVASGSTTITFLSSTGCKTDKVVTVSLTPNTTNPVAITACDSYTLPVIAGTNLNKPKYFDNTQALNGKVISGNLTTSQTVWIFDSTGVCTDEKSFTVAISTTPTVAQPADVNVCSAYVLPALANGNYYTGTGKTGVKLNAGDSIKASQKLYVYDSSATNGTCFAEKSFQINVNSSVANTPKDSSVCDTYILPAIANVTYYTGSNQTGTLLAAGDSIKSTQKIYAYVSIPGPQGCITEKNFTISVQTSPTLTSPIDIEECDSVALPVLAKGSYYTGTLKTGTLKLAGEYITTTQDLFVYFENVAAPNCHTEKIQKIKINNSPKLAKQNDTIVCDSIVLPNLAIGNYYGATNKGGINYGTSSKIKTSMPVYIYAESGTTKKCIAEKLVQITVKNAPVLATPILIEECDSVALPVLAKGNYYTGSLKTGIAKNAGEYITSTQDVYIYDETGNTPNCYSEKIQKITINKTPSLLAVKDTTVCDSLILPNLVLGHYYGATNKGGIDYGTSSKIKTSIPVFIYAETGTTKKCIAEKSFQITIKNSPNLINLTASVGCDSVQLPILVQGNYYSATLKGGVQLNAGSYVKASTTLYVYDETGGTPNCYSEITKTITVNKSSLITKPNDTTVCDSYNFPTIKGTNLTGNELYFSNPKNIPSQHITSPITSTLKLYLYDSLYSCSDQKSFTVTINNSPKINNPGPQSICDTFKLKKLTGTNLSGAENYYFNTQNNGGKLVTTTITNDTMLYIYDINKGCAYEDSFNVFIGQKPNVIFNVNKVTGCVPFTSTFTNGSTNIGDTSVWYFGTDSLVVYGDQPIINYTFKEAKCYDVTFKTSNHGCGNKLTKSNYICGSSTPIADFDFQPATATVLDPTISFINKSSLDATKYSWDFGDDSTSNKKDPKHTFYGKPQTYVVMLTASNKVNCSSQMVKSIEILDQLIYYVPNTFTPDGDEVNNFFKPIFYSGFDPQSYTLFIFDRWGEIIFESHDTSVGWDGTYGNKECLNGTYTWTIQVTDTVKKEVKNLHGHVNLIR
jgi:gliding motility-associated-like protein